MTVDAMETRRGWLLAAIAGAWVAQAAFGSAHPAWGLVPAAAMLAALKLARVRWSAGPPADGRVALVLGIAVILVAVAARVPNLAGSPPILWDEAIQAYDARCLASGLPLEPLEGIGYHRGPAWTRILAVAGRAVGFSYGGLRLVSAAAGVVCVALVFSAATRSAGLLAALVSAGWLAVGAWPVHLSRLLLGNGGVPLAGAAIVWVAGWSRWSLARRAVAAGLLAGASIWGYAAALFLPLLAAAACLLAEREPVRRRTGAAGLALAVSLVVALPAGMTPGLWAKAGEVSVISRPLVMARNAVAAAGVFQAHGDPDLRHNYPAGAPVFDGFMGPLFLLGLGLAIAGPGRTGGLVLAWLLLALTPGIASAGGGRDLFRLAGAAPAAALLAGAGATIFPAALGVRTGVVLAVALLAGAGARATLYAAVLAPADPATGVWYRTWAAQAGRDLGDMAARDPLRFREPLSLARHSVEKYALFDALHGGGSGAGPVGRLATAKTWEDSYGQPQAILLSGREGRWRTVSYRTVEDLAGEVDDLIRRGRTGDAVAAARRAVVLLPKAFVLRERLGFALLAAGELEGAVRAFAGIPARARSAATWDGIAAARFRQGRRKDAEDALREGLRLSPGDPELLADLARVRVAAPPAGPASMDVRRKTAR